MDEAEVLSEAQIRHMVSRFLGWRLPENFHPDNGISFKAEFNEHTAFPMRHQPVGTNLFSGDQATEMVRYMAEGLPRAESRSTPDREGGGLEEDHSGSLRSALGSAGNLTGGGGERSNTEADVLTEMLGLAWTFRDYAHDMLTGALRGRDGQSYEAIGAEDLARVDAVIAKVEGRPHG